MHVKEWHLASIIIMRIVSTDMQPWVQGRYRALENKTETLLQLMVCRGSGGAPNPNTHCMRFSHQISIIMESDWFGRKKNGNPFKNGKVSMHHACGSYMVHTLHYSLHLHSKLKTIFTNIWHQSGDSNTKQYHGEESENNRETALQYKFNWFMKNLLQWMKFE